MDDPPDHSDQFGDLHTPFIFVPHGDPEPVEWMAAHPGWVKFPAIMVPRAATAPDVSAAPGSSRDRERQPGTMWAFSRRPVPPDLRRPDPCDPMSPAFDPVLTLRKIGYTFGEGREQRPSLEQPPAVEARAIPPLDPAHRGLQYAQNEAGNARTTTTSLSGDATFIETTAPQAGSRSMLMA